MLRHAPRLLAALAAAAIAMPARAESVWVAGGSFAGSSRVAYASLVMPLAGRKLSDGWTQSIGVDAVRYEYERDGAPAEGFSRSVKYVLSRQVRVERGSLGIGIGATARETTIRPDDPGNRARGGQVRGMLEAQWQSTPGLAWRSQVFSQYVVSARNDFTVAFVGRRAGQVHLGIQTSTSGDPTYRTYGLAAAGIGWSVRGVEIGGYVGGQHLVGGSTRPDIGLTVVAYRP